MAGLSFGLCRVTLSRICAMVPHSTPHSASVEETFRPSALDFRRRKVGLRRATVSLRLAIVPVLEAIAEHRGRTLPAEGRVIFVPYYVAPAPGSGAPREGFQALFTC